MDNPQNNLPIQMSSCFLTRFFIPELKKKIISSVISIYHFHHLVAALVGFGMNLEWSSSNEKMRQFYH